MENLIECVVCFFIVIEFGNFVYVYRVLYIFQYVVDNIYVFDRLCFIYIIGFLFILFCIVSGYVFVLLIKKERMKRNIFLFIVVI